jgi:NADH-quinone oxidoreductase subunit A
MSAQYFPVLLLFLVGIGFAAAALIINALLGPKRSSGDPDLPDSRWTPFECGHDPVQPDNRRRISVKFYLVAVLFVLFDLEVVLLYPWAVKAPELGMFGFVELALFMVSLLVGLVYAWKKGALEWR